MNIKSIILGLFICVAALPPVEAAESNRKIVLHLRWDHQFQFAGFYAAQWQGYYHEAGLDVEIRSAFGRDGILRSAIDAVSDGEAHFGIGAADVLTAIDEGQPLTVVMPVFQQSPFAFFAATGTTIRGPADLIGRSIATRGSDGVAYPELRAMLRAEGIDPGNLEIKEAQENPAIMDVVSGKASVAAGSVLSVGWLEQRLGAQFTVIYPASYGVDFYGDSVFVRRDFLRQNGDLVRRFVEASTRGWQYALTQSGEVADRLSRELPRVVPVGDIRGFNRFQIAHVKRLTRFPAIPFGHINVERWRIMHAMLAEAGLVRGAFDPQSVFSTEPTGFSVPEWALPVFILVIVGANAVLVWLIFGLRARNRQLREAEAQRRDIEAQLKDFIDESPAVVSIRDVQGRYIYCNRAWEVWMGGNANEALGKTLSELDPLPLDPASLARAQESFASVVKTAKAEHHDATMWRADGSHANVHITRFPIHDAAGNVVSIGTVLQDMTRGRAAERERDVLAAQMKALVDHAPFSIALRDLDGRYLAVNKEWESLFGRNLEEVQGKTPWEVITDPDDPQFDLAQRDRGRFEHLLDGKVTDHRDGAVTRRDGTPIPVSIIRFPIRNSDREIVAVGVIMQNLTELRKADQARATVEAQLRAFIDHAPYLVTIRDTAGRYLICNRMWQNWWGFSEEEVRGKAHWELFTDPADPRHERVTFGRQKFNQVIETGEALHYETLEMMGPNEFIKTAVTRFPLRDSTGQIVAVGTISHDRSELEKLGRAQASLEARLKAFIEYAPMSVTITDIEGKYLAANSAFYAIGKPPVSDVINRSANDVFDAEKAFEVNRLTREVIESGKAKTGEVHTKHANGQEFWVSLTKFPLRDATGKINAVGAFGVDITEAHKARLGLEASEMRYKSLVEMSPEAILVHENGALLYANAVARRWLDIPPGESLLGKSIGDHLHADDRLAVRTQIASLVGDHTTILRKDFKIRLLDGTPVEVAITSSPIEFDGRPARQLVIHDVSERKRMEAQLVQNSKLATIGELSAGILHELAQPLNIARMAAQGALRRIRRGNGNIDDPGTQFELIESQMARMAGVIDHMRVFSRTEEPVEEVFDVRGAIRAAVQMVKQPFAAENILIETALPARRSFVMGRSIGIEQVVLNLLSNARDAIIQDSTKNGEQPGGGRIDVVLTIDSEKNQAVVTVSDTGGGIPKHAFPRLFDPFFTTKPIGRGTGLGLPVCQTIVRGMAGELSAENTQAGAKFTIRLPLHALNLDLEEKEAPAGQTETAALGVGRTALLVDDEPEALQLMADFFEEMGFDVRTASNGEEGLRCFRGETIDIVVTDIRLPVFDGIELAQMIRARNAAVPVIFVTGHLGLTDRIEVSGNQDTVRLLHKPIDLDLLERTVAEVLEPNTKVLEINTKT